MVDKDKVEFYIKLYRELGSVHAGKRICDLCEEMLKEVETNEYTQRKFDSIIEAIQIAVEAEEITDELERIALNGEDYFD